MASAQRIDDRLDPHVHTELCARVAQLDRDFRLLSVGELCRRVEAIRLIADAHGLGDAGRVAADLRLALENGGRNPAIRPHLDRMCDAIGCERPEPTMAYRYLSSTIPPRAAR